MSSTGGGVVLPNAPVKKQTWLGGMFSSITNVFEHEVFPFVENLFKTIALDNVAVLVPMAEKALEDFIATAEANLPAILKGDTSAFLKAVNATVAGTMQSAEAAVITTTATDIITASHAAVANYVAKAAAPPAA